MTVDVSPQKRRYWLLTMPRTASNMVVRILNLDEQNVRPAHNGGYFFFLSQMLRLPLYHKPLQGWSCEERIGLERQEKQCFEALQDYLEAAEEAGQKVYVKEHVSQLNCPFFESEYMHGTTVGDDEPGPPKVLPARRVANPTRSSLNLTPLPDEFLKTWHPTFLIRHPAKMLPSLFRTALEDIQLNGKGRSKKEPYEVETTLKFVRALHDFYLNHFGKASQWPIVIDADDVMMYPELVIKYAELTGLDPDKLRFTWEKTSQEMLDKLPPPQKIMFSVFNASTGVDKGKIAGNINIDTEAEKWRIEFGEEGGRKLERWVRDAMPDYEYLRSRRLTLD
ncbi:hypothetical protein HD806DRAFT_515915 [Xylariaceae sp. AK1471]|nr:hypothetical protein HD806DRAFT_515915 [Xylariaceae sp. AK1471]